jgi:tetratricopeptide (TPR) repeat protein
LRLTAEHEYDVPPLAVPSGLGDLAALARNDSVSMFVARARALERRFLLTDANAAAVAAICQRLEGLPLAIELAAARVKLLTPEQMLARIDNPLELLSGGGRDLPPRQQTLRAAIDWSYELLDEGERELFARFAVFAGGCTLEAVEQICDARLEALSGLLDNSLLRREQAAGREPRFRMLEAVREYADELLEAADRDVVRRRHAEYYVALAERLGPDLVGPRAQTTAERLLLETGNVRAVLAYALECDLELGFRLVSTLRSLWAGSARGREIRGWLEQAFEEVGPASTSAQVAALVVLGRQRMNDGEYDAARAALEDAADSGRRLGCPNDASVALTYLAWLSAAVGDYERCLRLGEEAIDLAGRGGSAWAERQALAMVAGTFVNRKQYDAARNYLDRSLALAEGLEDTNTIVLALGNSGYGALCAGDLGRARFLLESALQRRDRDRPPATAGVLHLLAWEASLSGDHERACTFLREALQILRDGGQLSHRVDVLSEAALAFETSAPLQAARFLGAAEAAFALRGVKRGIPAQERFASLHARLAADLGTSGFSSALAEGERLDLDTAIVEALAAVGPAEARSS